MPWTQNSAVSTICPLESLAETCLCAQGWRTHALLQAWRAGWHKSEACAVLQNRQGCLHRKVSDRFQGGRLGQGHRAHATAPRGGMRGRGFRQHPGLRSQRPAVHLAGDAHQAVPASRCCHRLNAAPYVPLPLCELRFRPSATMISYVEGLASPLVCTPRVQVRASGCLAEANPRPSLRQRPCLCLRPRLRPNPSPKCEQELAVSRVGHRRRSNGPFRQPCARSRDAADGLSLSETCACLWRGKRARESIQRRTWVMA
jgi:hypothetical protein